MRVVHAKDSEMVVIGEVGVAEHNLARQQRLAVERNASLIELRVTTAQSNDHLNQNGKCI